MASLPSIQEISNILEEKNPSFYPLNPKERPTFFIKHPLPYELIYSAICPNCQSDAQVKVKTSSHGFTKTHILFCDKTHVLTRIQKFLNPFKTGCFKPIPVNDLPLF